MYSNKFKYKYLNITFKYFCNSMQVVTLYVRTRIKIARMLGINSVTNSRSIQVQTTTDQTSSLRFRVVSLYIFEIVYIFST